MCTLFPLLTHLTHIASPGDAAPEAALAGWKGPQGQGGVGARDSLLPRPRFPRSAPIGRPREWAWPAAGSSAPGGPEGGGRRARAGAGVRVRAAGDAPGQCSCRACERGCSRGRGAESPLKHGRGGASYGPAEAVSSSFAP